jgi:hypothetical protein
MTEMPRFGLRDFLLLLLVLAVAAAARVGYFLYSLEDPAGPPPLAAQGPLNPARAGTESKGWGWWRTAAHFFEVNDNEPNKGEETAHIAPGYPWLVGSLAGKEGDARLAPDQTVVVLRWAQCALGALTAGLYFFFARRAFRSVLVGTLAGLFCALHPFWVINTLEFNDGVLASFLLGLALATGARASQEGDAFASLLYGLALAGLVLVRAALLPFAVVACLWFLLRCRKVQRGWLCALLTFLGFANGLAPLTVRNFRVFHEIVPVADSMYVHLWMGVNAEADGGPQDEKTLRKTLGPEASRAVLAEKNQSKRYNMLAWNVLERGQEDPADVLHKRLRAGLCFVFGRAWLDHGRLVWVQPRVAEDYPGILPGTLLGMLVLSVLGWRWTYGWRFTAMPSSLAVLWIPLPYILSHAEELSGPRLPLDGVLLCYSAFALLCLVPGIGGRLLRGADAGPQTEGG